MIAAFLGGYFAFQIPELTLIIIMIICLIISGLVMTFYKISDTKNTTQSKGSIREFFCWNTNLIFWRYCWLSSRSS